MNLYIQNLRGWPLSHEAFIRTLDKLAETINNNWFEVVALSEMIPGKDEFYIKYLMDSLNDPYALVRPVYDLDTHYRSAVNVILIRQVGRLRNASVNTLRMPNDEEFSGLYNYAFVNGVAIINCHLIQLFNEDKPVEYQEERRRKAEAFKKAIEEEVSILLDRGAKVLVCGDMNSRTYNPSSQLRVRTHAATFFDSDGHGHPYDKVITNIPGGTVSLVMDLWPDFSDHRGLVYRV